MSLFFKSGSKSTDFTSDLPPGGTADAPSPLAPSSISPSTVAESIEEGLTYATPWPNNTYIIVEKGSGQAISLNGGALELYDFSDHEDVNIQWLCVERQGYFGFFNTKSGVYLGHNSKETIQASATAFEDWEVVTPRHHPDGGGWEITGSKTTWHNPLGVYQSLTKGAERFAAVAELRRGHGMRGVVAAYVDISCIED